MLSCKCFPSRFGSAAAHTTLWWPEQQPSVWPLCVAISCCLSEPSWKTRVSLCKLTKWEFSFASCTCCTCGSATTFVSWSEVMSRLLGGSSGRSLRVAEETAGGQRDKQVRHEPMSWTAKSQLLHVWDQEGPKVGRRPTVTLPKPDASFTWRDEKQTPTLVCVSKPLWKGNQADVKSNIFQSILNIFFFKIGYWTAQIHLYAHKGWWEFALKWKLRRRLKGLIFI